MSIAGYMKSALPRYIGLLETAAEIYPGLMDVRGFVRDAERFLDTLEAPEVSSPPVLVPCAHTRGEALLFNELYGKPLATAHAALARRQQMFDPGDAYRFFYELAWDPRLRK